MGRGDKRTRKGKITIGSYGKSRPRKVAVSAVAAVKAAPVAKAVGAVSKTAPKATGAKTDKKKKA